MTALMVCMRFSASSKTLEALDSNTSSVHFHLGDAEALGDVSTDGGVGVVEGRQAVQEDGALVGHGHDFLGHAERLEHA